MNNIFEKLKKTYNPNENTLDYEKAFKFDNNSTLIEEQLQYLILKKRYDNLGRFLKNQTQDYENLDIEGLQNLLFFYNDLKEINFIGTDLYANTLFIKNTVPFLYRCVGKDSECHIETDKEDPIKIIFEKCLDQIETGAKGSLFSYSKCFGVALYKYANLMSEITPPQG